MLELQAWQLKNNASRAIEISSNRIYTMSLIHQLAYQSEDATTVDMSKYLPEFIRHQDPGWESDGTIRYQNNIEPIRLGIGQAIPVALIINEAVNNSIKYAYPADTGGTIMIDMLAQGDTATLCIADKGVGIDPKLVDQSPTSLGLTLIRQFSEEIHGQLQISSAGGTSVTVVFKKLPVDLKQNRRSA